MRRLEENLGRALFHRVHGRVELTPLGSRFASELSNAFGQIKRSVEVVRGKTVHRLRISVEQAFAAYWLVPRLGGFSMRHPNVEVTLDSSDELRVLGREADIAIRFLRESTRRPRGAFRKIFSLRGFPCVAKTVVDLDKAVSDDEVLAYRLLHDDDGTNWRSWFAAAGVKGFDRARHLHFNENGTEISRSEFWMSR